MARSIQRKTERTPEEVARIRAIREQLQREKPSLAQITAEAGSDGPFKQGYVLTLGPAMHALRELRQEAGLTLADMETRTGIDQATLSKLESGHTLNPTLYTLWRYARALGPKGRFVGQLIAELFSSSLELMAQADEEVAEPVATTS